MRGRVGRRTTVLMLSAALALLWLSGVAEGSTKREEAPTVDLNREATHMDVSLLDGDIGRWLDSQGITDLAAVFTGHSIASARQLGAMDDAGVQTLLASVGMARRPRVRRAHARAVDALAGLAPSVDGSGGGSGFGIAAGHRVVQTRVVAGGALARPPLQTASRFSGSDPDCTHVRKLAGVTLCLPLNIAGVAMPPLVFRGHDGDEGALTLQDYCREHALEQIQCIQVAMSVALTIHNRAAG